MQCEIDIECAVNIHLMVVARCVASVPQLDAKQVYMCMVRMLFLPATNL